MQYTIFKQNRNQLYNFQPFFPCLVCCSLLLASVCLSLHVGPCIPRAMYHQVRVSILFYIVLHALDLRYAMLHMMQCYV